MRSCFLVSFLWALSSAAGPFVPSAAGQVDQAVAKTYFAEVAALCEREGGRLWGVPLCGPLALVDAVTRTSATSEPAPSAPTPPSFGYANTALDWGGTRWSTVVWRMIPESDARSRGRLIIHELFHRVQPQLDLLVQELPNGHLDTLEGRYWLRLEWRALAKGLQGEGAARRAALADALAFRARRFSLFPGAAESERRMEINEGLAQYTGTVVVAGNDREAAIGDARDQLARYDAEPTFVRVFAYPAGTVYGLLLDEWSPGWTRRLGKGDDLAQRAAAAAGVSPAPDVEAAAARYAGTELRAAEERRDVEQKARVAELRRLFVEGPVLALPRVGKVSFSFVTTGMTPIPEVGTVYPTCRVNAEWGSLEADRALMADDNTKITVPAPARTDGSVVKGDGWTLQLAPGWTIGPGARSGDYMVVRVPEGR